MWGKKYEIAIQPLDRNRQYILKLLNNIPSSPEITKTDLQRLKGYLKVYFEMEESLLFIMNHKEMEKHRESHNSIMNKLKKLNLDIDSFKEISKAIKLHFSIENFEIEEL